MVDGVRDRRGVDDRVVAADERVRAAGVGEVGLEVAHAPRGRALEGRRGAVRGGDAVARAPHRVDGGGADLPARAGDEDAHPPLLPRQAPGAPAASGRGRRHRAAGRPRSTPRRLIVVVRAAPVPAVEVPVVNGHNVGFRSVLPAVSLAAPLTAAA